MKYRIVELKEAHYSSNYVISSLVPEGFNYRVDFKWLCFWISSWYTPSIEEAKQQIEKDKIDHKQRDRVVYTE